MDKLRIIIGTTRPFHLFHLARELAELGHSVQLYSYIPKSFAARYNHGNAVHHSLAKRHPIDTALSLQKSHRKLQDQATIRMLRKTDDAIVARLTDCDVFIGLSGMAQASLLAARKRFGALSICDRGSTHVDVQNQILSQNDKSRLSDEYVGREKQGYENADYIAVPSLYSKNSFVVSGVSEDKLFLNNYGVDLFRFRNSPLTAQPSTKKKAIFVGAWSYRKGCDILTQLLAMDPTVELTHVGTAGDMVMPDCPRFTTLGPLSNSALAHVYRKHHFLILPSREDGFGMVLLEALASGLQVIASRNTGGPDIAIAPACPVGRITIVDRNSAEEISTAISNMSKASSAALFDLEREALADAFSWRAYGRRYEDFLYRCFARKVR